MLRSLAAALIILLLAVTGLHFNAQRGLHADDDNLWLQFLASGMPDLEQGKKAEGKAIAFAEAHGAGEASMVRLAMRRDYGNNYALPVFLWHEIAGELPPPAEPAAYPAYISQRLALTMGGTSLAAWGILILVLAALNRPALWTGFAAGLSLCAALMLWPNSPPSMLLLRFDGLWPAWKNAFHFILNQWHGFSVFSFSPRNNLSVLLLAVFALRWSSHIRASWLFMLPLYGVHSSLCLLVTLHLLALDILRQRHVLRDPVVLSAAFSGLAYGLWAETLWPTVASSLLVQAALGLMGLGFLWAVFASKPLLRLEAKLSRPYRWIEQYPAPVAETLWLGLFWLASVLPTFFVSLSMSDAQNRYFWHQIQGRAVGALGAVCFVGLAHALPGKLATRLTLLGCLVWLAGFGVAFVRKPSPLEVARLEAEKLEACLTSGNSCNAPAPGFVLDEPLLYYALGQMMVMHTNRLNELFARASASNQP